MKENPIVTKSFAFALRIVKLHRYLVEEHKEFTLSRELLMAGTSIGKYVVAAEGAESRSTFATQMSIAFQKAAETEYWLQLIHFAEYISEKEFLSIDTDREELSKMLSRISTTARKNE